MTRQLLRLHIVLAALLLSACATFEPQPIDVGAGPGELLSRTEGAVTVTTTILSDDQAERLYGVDLASAGLQAVWLRIENRGERAFWLLVSALDANYYTPDEAAVLFFGPLGDEDEARLTRHFRDLAIPLKASAGTVSEGYVLVPRQEGGRYVVVSMVGQEGVLDFGFAVTLPDGDFDFERLDPERIYAGSVRPDLDLVQLRETLQTLPCCTRDKSGENEGDPMNLVVIGDAGDVLAAMARAGWSFTHRIDVNTVERMIRAALSGSEYKVAPVSPLYFFGRSQDMALQRARNTIVQRNHLRLWLAPFRYEGESVWVGQISRDIGVKATTKSPTLTTHIIDPNVDEAREHLLQSLMVAGVIERFAFVRATDPTAPDAPRSNLTGDPYITDGLRVVVFLSGSDTTPPGEVEFIEWRNSADPVERAKQALPADGMLEGARVSEDR